MNTYSLTSGVTVSMEFSGFVVIRLALFFNVSLRRIYQDVVWIE